MLYLRGQARGPTESLPKDSPESPPMTSPETTAQVAKHLHSLSNAEALEVLAPLVPVVAAMIQDKDPSVSREQAVKAAKEVVLTWGGVHRGLGSILQEEESIKAILTA